MDAALLIQNVYHDGTPTSNARPTILTPLVCAATTMNAWPTATGEGGDAQFYVNGSGSSNQQTQWEREHIAAPHPRWVISPVTGDYELTEYNAWMWHGFQPPIGAGLDARSRRALYRPSDGVPQPTPEHFPQSVRRQHHGFEASPGMLRRRVTICSHEFLYLLARLPRSILTSPIKDTTHAFEFYSDYFDATTFIVQPTFAQRKDISDNPLYSHSLTTLIQQSPLARQLTQCWSLDVYRGLADAQGVARVYIVCRSKPMGPVGAVIYFWTIVLELAMEM